ncbi:MAG: hypothetical protein ACJ73D_10915 [Pyrinomonadaceae bacterium]
MIKLAERESIYMKNQLIVMVLVGLLALSPLQQPAMAQGGQPLPVPKLKLSSIEDYRNLGTHFTYTFSVINWVEFQRQVDQRFSKFDRAKMQLPPSPCKSQGNSGFQSRMAAIIYSTDERLGCYALFSPKGQLMEIKLTLPKGNAPDSFYLAITDLLTRESVKSNVVFTGSHDKPAAVTNSLANNGRQGEAGNDQRRSGNGRQQPSTGDLPKVLFAQGNGVTIGTGKRKPLPPYHPQVLSPAQMQSVLKSAVASMPNKPVWFNENEPTPINNFLTLTPQRSYAEGKGRLAFEDATSVDTGSSLEDQGSVFFDLTNYEGRVEIYLKPEYVGQSFIVTVSLLQPFTQTPFTVDLPDGRQETYLMPILQKDATSLPSMFLFFTANNTSWQRIGITNHNAKGFAGWLFNKCEVTSVQAGK